MATFNLAGSSILNLTPTRQASGSDNIRFAQEMFNLKRAIALSSVDYWCVQGDQIAFIQRGSVAHTHFTLKAVHFITFDVTEYQNLQHAIPLQVNGGNAVVKGHTAAASQSIAFTLGNSVKHSYKLAGTTSITFTLTPTGVRALQRAGVSAATFTVSGTTKPARALSGSTSLTFTAAGDNVPVSNPYSFTALVFNDSNSIRISKSVSAIHSVAVISGGFGLVY